MEKTTSNYLDFACQPWNPGYNTDVILAVLFRDFLNKHHIKDNSFVTHFHGVRTEADYDTVRKDLEEKFNFKCIRNYSGLTTLDRYNSYAYENEYCFLTINLDNNSINFGLNTPNASLIEDLKKYILAIPVKKLEDKTINVICVDRGELTFRTLSNKKYSLEIGNYTPEVVSDTETIITEFAKEASFGRLAIFSGPPGVGKTHLIKYIASNVENVYTVLIPVGLSHYIDKPEFMDYILSIKEGHRGVKSFLFLIEDADEILIRRSQGNYSLLSSFLNFTDGLMGECLNVKFIATTNSAMLEIDDAFKRPGRLFKYTNVDLLPPAQASKVYERLTDKNKKYSDPTSLAKIYADAYDKSANGVKNKAANLGFGK